MPKIAYEAWSPTGDTRQLVDAANAIIEEYAAQGFNLTLRQLYYQFVARDMIPNQQRAYKRLGDIISRARRAGMIDWDAIVDRTRQLRTLSMWDSPQQILRAVAQQFRLNPWDQQDCYVEVWFEKDALMGVFERPANAWRLPYFSCRGYASDSEVWAAAQRLAAMAEDGRDVIVLHFGDHDPSGIDMSRDIEERLHLFGAAEVEVKRVALTFAQVRQYNPQPNPAKETDSRFASYQDQYGEASWELDALDPQTLAALIDAEIRELLDPDQWEADLAHEATERTRLEGISRRYTEIVGQQEAREAEEAAHAPGGA